MNITEHINQLKSTIEQLPVKTVSDEIYIARLQGRIEGLELAISISGLVSDDALQFKLEALGLDETVQGLREQAKLAFSYAEKEDSAPRLFSELIASNTTYLTENIERTLADLKPIYFNFSSSEQYYYDLISMIEGIEFVVKRLIQLEQSISQ
jgi:hypothetical protein